ncbi:hypothetical protein [Thermostaphylospora chromogena]|uniref:Uncharacterized protein n=1 Tax=Thermostaphylospora chromogena TaxID=35622 RepID=A0A1H1DMB8_9ACTN|nr:hypothetical protein [Thermostaphylospora chromogena]SDQ77681.1 hypothetical protein SAMN04489764_2077 [Thermostaphylospora chromogena]
MARDPYTYVTVSIRPAEPSRVWVSFCTPELDARAGVLESGRPFLDISSTAAGVTISTTGAGPVTAADLETARQIFNAAARYLADCERLHTTQATDGDPATSSSAPGGEAAA